jgi:hypothetical protein
VIDVLKILRFKTFSARLGLNVFRLRLNNDPASLGSELLRLNFCGFGSQVYPIFRFFPSLPSTPTLSFPFPSVLFGTGFRGYNPGNIFKLIDARR